MLKVYGSKMCPDCMAFKFNLDFYHIEYEYVDINESMKNLKEFLIIRDKNPLFLDVKENGYVGIPACVSEDGNITLDWEIYLKKMGYNPISISTNACCAKNGKGC